MMTAGGGNVGDWQGATSLAGLYEATCNCTRCELGHSRNRYVFGVGNERADILFVGEGPGANEDQQGIPFVGQAGQFLDQLLASIGLVRSDIYIANCVKCRPPGNRDPLPEELAMCTPYLFKQVELIAPRIICTLGNFATKTLLKTTAGITSLHGQRHQVDGLVYVPLFHPAAALHRPPLKSTLIDDFRRLQAYLDEDLGRSSEASIGAGKPVSPEAAAPEAPDSPPEQLGLF
jgi:uracil-DNA glycosylase family 4